MRACALIQTRICMSVYVCTCIYVYVCVCLRARVKISCWINALQGLDYFSLYVEYVHCCLFTNISIVRRALLKYL